ncbi:hypothetical protein ZWY2020_005259 [Hordeum vulgare]|nr:hypothetical protein ZWY2020_005259 [Hordeum vulgare]
MLRSLCASCLSLGTFCADDLADGNPAAKLHWMKKGAQEGGGGGEGDRAADGRGRRPSARPLVAAATVPRLAHRRITGSSVAGVGCLWRLRSKGEGEFVRVDHS